MNEIPPVLWVTIGAAIAGLIGAFGYWLRSTADARKDTATARNQVSVDTARANNAQQTTATDAVTSTLAALISLLKDAVEGLGKANEIASRERADTSTVLREMVEQMRAMNGKVDERLTPVMPLLITITAQITTLMSSGQTNAAAIATLKTLLETVIPQLSALTTSFEDMKTELKKANEKDIP